MAHLSDPVKQQGRAVGLVRYSRRSSTRVAQCSGGSVLLHGRTSSDLLARLIGMLLRWLSDSCRHEPLSSYTRYITPALAVGISWWRFLALHCLTRYTTKTRLFPLLDEAQLTKTAVKLPNASPAGGWMSCCSYVVYPCHNESLAAIAGSLHLDKR